MLLNIVSVFFNLVLLTQKGDDCKTTKTGSEYSGKRDRTREGIPCERWDFRNPDVEFFLSKISFPGATVSAQENFCRNPNSILPEGSWCFTANPKVGLGMCDIPLCFNGKKTY